MKLYWIKAQAPRRVLALVRHLGLDVETIDATKLPGGMKSPEYARLNPNRQAPTLVDGDLVLWESSAIMAHLCNTVGSDMWPARDPDAQVEVLRWLSWNDQSWAPAVAPFYFEHVVKATFRLGPPDLDALPLAIPELRRCATILDAHLANRAFVACGRLTIADFQLASMATYWRESQMPLDDYRHVVRWIDALMAIPAWADPWPT